MCHKHISKGTKSYSHIPLLFGLIQNMIFITKHVILQIVIVMFRRKNYVTDAEPQQARVLSPTLPPSAND